MSGVAFQRVASTALTASTSDVALLFGALCKNPMFEFLAGRNAVTTAGNIPEKLLFFSSSTGERPHSALRICGVLQKSPSW